LRAEDGTRRFKASNVREYNKIRLTYIFKQTKINRPRFNDAKGLTA